FADSLMQFFQYAVQMSLVFPVHFYVQPDPQSVAWKGTSENSGILCSGAYGIIPGEGIRFPKARRAADDFHKLVFWGGKHVRCKGVSFQKL
ncbi:hypothetical protein, partial [Clostridioides difficile]|uniref:hypothetical protein n=1 Tax=Clostridioides difficile TaxID=1496 RepID=UPI002ED3202A